MYIFIVVFAVLIEVHAVLDDISVEKDLVSTWRKIGYKMYTGELLTTDEWSRLISVREELRRRGIDVVHLDRGSVRVWLLCHTNIAVIEVRSMVDDGRLRQMLVELFLGLFKCGPKAHSSQLSIVNVTVEANQFQLARMCFTASGRLHSSISELKYIFERFYLHKNSVF